MNRHLALFDELPLARCRALVDEAITACSEDAVRLRLRGKSREELEQIARELAELDPPAPAP